MYGALAIGFLKLSTKSTKPAEKANPAVQCMKAAKAKDKPVNKHE